MIIDDDDDDDDDDNGNIFNANNSIRSQQTTSRIIYIHLYSPYR